MSQVGNQLSNLVYVTFTSPFINEISLAVCQLFCAAGEKQHQCYDKMLQEQCSLNMLVEQAKKISCCSLNMLLEQAEEHQCYNKLLWEQCSLKVIAERPILYNPATWLGLSQSSQLELHPCLKSVEYLLMYGTC